MAIEFDKFLRWAEARWDGDVVVKGNEIKVNSMFCEDFKHHLWCNPTGGKKELPNGVFRCWKTDRRGSLVTLVMLRDGVSYQEALDILGGTDCTMAELEKKLAEIMGKKDVEIPIGEIGLKLPDHTFPIDTLDPDNFFKIEAEMYMQGRCLPTEGLYICCDGDYKYRIVIPYYDREGRLIYFNARYLNDSDKVAKYRGPDKEVGIGKGDVLYMPAWYPAGRKLYLTEGEFDAMSLRVAGLDSGAFGGKTISELQAEYLRGYTPVLCVDNDKAGKSALPDIKDKLTGWGYTMRYVRPPSQFKDWNEMLKKAGPNLIKAYIDKYEKEFTENHRLEMAFGQIPPSDPIKLRKY